MGRLPKRLHLKASHWFQIDDEARYSVYTATIQGIKLSNVPYWVELVLASGIATLGLVLNSPAIVIGAMLISPLMTPIMGTGLALATGDFSLGVRAFLNCLLSILVGFLVSYSLVAVLPFKDATPEILARIHPTILDLAVALLSGFAGSIATLKSSKGLTAALPGTAIAVALLPPLCVIGLGFGVRSHVPHWGEISKGAALLFAANLVAIVMTSMIVFLLVRMGRKTVRQKVEQWRLDSGQFNRFDAWLTQSGISGGKLGSLQARLVVILIFFLMVYFPLQKALTRVVGEISRRTEREKQVKVINQTAKDLFRVKNRSDIENIEVEETQKGLSALVRVNTNRLFGKETKLEFESRVRMKLDMPVHAVLIQSPGFFGDEKETDWSQFLGLKTREEKKTTSLEETCQLMFDRVRSVVEGLWSQDAGSLLDFKFHLEERSTAEIALVLQLTYLAEMEMAQSAKSIFSSGVRQSLGFEPEIRWDWINSEYGPFTLSPGSTILPEQARAGLLQISNALKRFPQLQPEIHFLSASGREPRVRKPLSREELTLKISEELKEQGIPSPRFVLSEHEGSPPQLRLSLRIHTGQSSMPQIPVLSPSPSPSPGL